LFERAPRLVWRGRRLDPRNPHQRRSTHRRVGAFGLFARRCQQFHMGILSFHGSIPLGRCES
jgi:hypothetical protein